MSKNHYSHGRLIYIGSFNVESGTLHISDPCYKDLREGIDVSVENGTWHAFIRHHKEDSWFSKGDERVGELIAIHQYGQSKNKEDRTTEPRWKKIGNVGVDSGQMSIFDKKFYRDDKEAAGRDLSRFTYGKNGAESGDDFYAACGCITLPPHLFDMTLSIGGTMPHGAVSPSGEGDGGYSVYAAKKVTIDMLDKKKKFVHPNISAVRVVFLGDTEEEE